MVDMPDDPVVYETAMSTMALDPEIDASTRDLSDIELHALREKVEQWCGQAEHDGVAGWFSALACLLIKERVRRQLEYHIRVNGGRLPPRNG